MSCNGKTEAERFSDLALERFVLGVMPGEERERLARHLEGCPHCRLQIESKQGSEEQFAGTVLPGTLPAVLRESEPPVPWWSAWRSWGLGGGLVAAAAAAVLLLVLMPPALDGDASKAPAAVESARNRAKGGAAMRIYALRGSEQFRVTRDMVLRPGDALKFVPDLGGYDYVWILSVEESGKVSPLVPYDGYMSARLPGPPGEALPGSIILDDAVGPEEIWAVFSRRPLVQTEAIRWVSEVNDGPVPLMSEELGGVKKFKLRILKDR